MTPRIQKIGIDARFYGEAGPGRYVKNIIKHLEKQDLKNQYLVFLRRSSFDLYQPNNANFKKVIADYPWYSFSEQILFLMKVVAHRLDLFYVPHFNIPILYPGKIVCAIPDIIMHTFSTEAGTTLPRFYFRLKKKIYFLVVFWAVLRSHKVIVPSFDVKKDFINVYPSVSEKKFVLAYEGIDDDLIKLESQDANHTLTKLGINTPFILYVGSMYVHKNIFRLLEAFKILRSEHGFKGSLVIVGKKDKFSELAVDKATELGLKQTVIFPGEKKYVTDNEANDLRAKALVYVFPSLKEGFSLTPMEGMLKGLPAVISDIPCHREVYGDSVYYFDPTNSRQIAERVDVVLKNPNLRSELVKKGYELVKKYSWDETAMVTLSVFNQALKDSQ